MIWICVDLIKILVKHLAVTIEPEINLILIKVKKIVRNKRPNNYIVLNLKLKKFGLVIS